MYYDPRVNYFESIASHMYPERYHKLLPYIKKVCDKEDYPENLEMHPFPNEEKLNIMSEEVLNYYKIENSDDFPEELTRGRRPRHHHHHHHKKNDPINDIIKILIIKELIDRRCKKKHHHYW